MTAGLTSYLLLAAFLFSVGLACILVRRNTIQILMGVELVFNAAALNFVAFEHFAPSVLNLSGQVMALFIIVLAAAEAVVALALVLSVFRVFRTVDVSRVEELKG